MLINPESHDFALRWHRDDIRESATEEEERDALAEWHYGVSEENTRNSCTTLIPHVTFSAL